MSNGDATRQPLAFVFALGVLGGGTLIATISLSHRGPLIFLPYIAIVLAAAAYLRSENVRPFSRRLALSVGSFMLATMILYMFVYFFISKTGVQISIGGHAWRIGLMILIGLVIGAAVAQLTATKSAEHLHGT